MRQFEPDLESEFQETYYIRVQPTLRVITLLLAVMFVLYTARDYADTQDFALAFGQDGTPATFFAGLFALTWWPKFERYWQTFILLGGYAVSAFSFAAMASYLASMHLAGMVGDTTSAADSLFFGQQIRLVMVCLALLRLQFRFALRLHLGLLLIGLWAFVSRLLTTSPTANDISHFMQPTVAILAALLLAAFVEEQLSRSAFWSNHLLELERNDEKSKREQTESMLHVLSQSIGGIVHDLGNPLTTVRMGAQTLELCLDSEDTDPTLVQEITRTIGEGALMLDYLRLSLMEQTRVLEGQPSPIARYATPVTPIVELGAHLQKPSVSYHRQVVIDGDNVAIYADKMKMATVFMNLIGNALKYSDGAVKVRWRQLENESMLLIAVCDQGTGQRGITRQNASQLFTAFGRLETHKAVEGTGLGLLSIRNIVAAHDGQSYIEGFETGLSGSLPFSTASRPYPSLLEADFRTAFVVTCPLATQDP